MGESEGALGCHRGKACVLDQTALNSNPGPAIY